MSQTKKLFNLPKGIGISSKLFLIVFGVFLVVLIFVLAMIFHYRGADKTTTVQDQNTLVQQQTGLSPDAAIAALNKDAPNGVLINGETKPIPVQQGEGVVVPVSQQGAVSEPPSQAAQSPIAVMNNFQGVSSSSSSSDSGQIEDLSKRADQLNNLAQDALSNISNGMGGDGYGSQNMQNKKVAFLQAKANPNKKFYLDSSIEKPVSPYEVKAGTIIPATLLTGIQSDLPGQITAQVSSNVFDTVTGNFLLIPQGTRILGVYDSQISYGQSRVLIAWSRLIFPNGDSFDLEGQPGVDLMGMAGLSDQVNNHYVRIFGSALAFSMFGALGQLSQPKQAANSAPTNEQIIYGAVGQNLTQAGVQMTEKNMNIQPTITIRPGANFNILLTRDMVLPGIYQH